MKRFVVWHYVPRYAGGPRQVEVFVEAPTAGEAIAVGARQLNVSAEVARVLVQGPMNVHRAAG